MACCPPALWAELEPQLKMEAEVVVGNGRQVPKRAATKSVLSATTISNDMTYFTVSSLTVARSTPFQVLALETKPKPPVGSQHLPSIPALATKSHWLQHLQSPITHCT